MKNKEILTIILLKITIIHCYSFQSPIDNLLYIKNSSTLFAISSSHLHQLHWSTTTKNLLLLHRRVQLHPTIDNAEYGVSVFVYDSIKQLLLICARSSMGRCILYDANDISRTYLLDSTMETNYLGCSYGCYTFMSSNIIRSAINGNRLERSGNIVNSQIEAGKDLLSYNIKYQLKSSDHALITSLTFLPERLEKQRNYEYVYGFDYEQYTYYLLKSSRIARLCQSTIAMRVTYNEIPLLNCNHHQNSSSFVTGAFHSFDTTHNLFVVFEHYVCTYSMDEIVRAFQESKIQCLAGNGYRLAHIVDSSSLKPTCEKTFQSNITDTNECAWQSYRTNLYIDGTVGAVGDLIYQTMSNRIHIRFIFVQDDIVIMSTSERRMLKFIWLHRTRFYLLHEAIYHTEPFNPQYVIDNAHESLIFAVGSELHRYAYNSCSLYDTCQSCVGSRRYDSKSCIWFDGKCSLTSNPLIFDRGCPPLINQIYPINVSVNTERVLVNITGTFEGVHADSVNIIVKFPLANQNQFLCSVEAIQNDSLLCSLIVPKQPVAGTFSIDIKPKRILSKGDTDITGLIELFEKFHVYVPKPILVPNYGPAIGGTKIRIKNLDFDPNLDLYSRMKIFFGQQQCDIHEIATNEIICINQACQNDSEQQELIIQVDNNLWQTEKVYFRCESDPIILDWYPKKSIISGGFKLIVDGKNLDTVQRPLVKFLYNQSDYEFSSFCESVTSTQMTCLSPGIDKNFHLSPPLDLYVTFIMDNAKIIPENNNILQIVNDPIYYPFKNYVQEINSTHIIKLEGSNLASTHSIDLVDVRIDNVDNACIPFNLTNTSLMCMLSKIAIEQMKDSEADVEIRIGTNLTFLMGKIMFPNSTRPLPALSAFVKRQVSLWTMTGLILLSSITILSMIFFIVILIRRRLCHLSGRYYRRNEPPPYYLDVWSELGKKWQINPKYLTLGDQIGQGCFGDVYKGELKQEDNKPIEVAVKVLRDQNVASVHEFLFEANRMKDFSHTNVLSLIGVAWDTVRKAMVILPYMKNGDLRSYIINEKNRPTVRQLITWGIQVADGMEYLSSLKFVHRDLATRNCMLDENLICRISDFGLSRDVFDRDYYLVPRTTTKEKDGLVIQIPPRRLPIRWLSPESIESSRYTIQSDVWSFGVLLWELLSRGKTPYSGIDNADIYTCVKNGYRLAQPTYCPTLLYKSAMVVCWHANPAQRPTFTQLAHDIRNILHQLELEQQKIKTSSTENDATTFSETYLIDPRTKRYSASSVSPANSLTGPYITTTHPQSENLQLISGRDVYDDDAYILTVNSSAEIFSTSRLLPRYIETSITEDV